MASSAAARGGAGSVRNNGPHPPPPPGRPPLPSQSPSMRPTRTPAADWLRPRFNAFDPQEPACWSCGCFLGKVLRWMLLPTAIECCHECFFYRVFRRRLHRRNMHGGILSPFTGNGRVAKVCAMRYV